MKTEKIVEHRNRRRRNLPGRTFTHLPRVFFILHDEYFPSHDLGVAMYQRARVSQHENDPELKALADTMRDKMMSPEQAAYYEEGVRRLGVYVRTPTLGRAGRFFC